MTSPFADRLFRIAFAAAGVYNLAFGLWATVWPMAFFELFAIAPPRYPGIWACLGMVVGVYGLLYLHAAWRLETAWPIVAVGLLGKVLGPVGMALSFGDDWPRRLGMLCIYNDLVWWLPFGLFLLRGTVAGRGLARWAATTCVVLHVAAIAAMAFLLRGGTLVEPDAAKRAAYIAEHAAAWSAGWAVWMLAAMSLVGFYAWWGSRLSARTTAIAGTILAASGMVFDFSGEGLSMLVLVERAEASIGADSPALRDAADFVKLERTITLLTAGAANGLYTLGGVLLTLVTPGLPPWVRATMWTTWLAGLGMTLAAVVDSVSGMAVSTAVLFPLLVVWVSWMGWRMTKHE
jgi:hypothetical protein